MRWNILYPKTKRPWPGYLVDAAGEPVPGTYDPETVRFRALRPIDDPAIGGGKAWLDRGRVVAYRPGSRAVVRIPGGSSPLYAKLSRPSRARRSLAVHEAIRRLAAAAGSFPGFPEIVEAEPDAGVVVHRSVPGTPLHRFLIEGPSGDAVDRMAVAIASLHLVEPPADEVALAPRGSIPLRDWLSFVETHYPALAGPYREAHREIERARPHPFEGSLRIVHGDLHDKNVHLDGSRLYLLDLDSFSVGDPAVDAGNLAAHLVLRAIQRGETAEAGRLDANRFLEAYRRAGGTADSPRTRWERSASLFRLACVYLFRRRWRERAPELVTEARETLRSHGA
jgi:aminoglycoside phosphotransferase (APT) family kinase protein